MTRHNLDRHISWLLSHEVTPPVGVQATLPTYSRIEAGIADEEFLEEEAGEEIIRSPPNLARNRQVLEAVNVVQDFARPTIPSSIIPRSQMPEPHTSRAEGAMGTLTSASKSTRPKLVSQPQLATPASTTTSTAPSSLKQGYATFLRNNNGTTSSKPSNDTPVPRFSRALNTPQTPRQTPRPTIEVKTETVDLTGDDPSEIRTSRSSSVEIFGDSQLLWEESAAWRAEPLPKTSKKRKSDDMSRERPKRTNTGASHLTDSVREHSTGLDGFVDIDDLMPPSQKTHTSPQNIFSKSVRPSIERTNARNDFEKEYQVTENISRVETRTRKSFSRVPLETGSIAPDPAYPQLIKMPASRTTGLEMAVLESGAAIQVAASPVSKSLRTLGESALTPQRRQKRRLQRTVLDSEDDEVLSDVEKRASCSPQSVKKSPRVVGSPESPKVHTILSSEPTETKFRDLRESKSRTGSPLRPISRNLTVNPERVPSPFHRDSPTRLSVLRQQSSQQTPASSVGPDDRKLIILYLNQPPSISLYCQRIDNSLDQNALAAARYEDEGELAPILFLKEERKSLLGMRKAYTALASLAARWRSVTREKKDLVREMSKLLDINEDTSAVEEKSSSLTRDIRKIEQEVGQLLHASGAINDGFGTGSTVDTTTPPRAEASKTHENTAPLPSGSSVVGSGQVILQTQIPALAPQSASISKQRLRDDQPSKHPSEERISTNLPIHGSPSPVRYISQGDPFPARQDSTTSRIDWASPKGKMKQPDFYRDQLPMDYGFDADEDIFDDLLQGEAEVHNDAKVPEDVPDDVEDDYGDDEDYEEMLEVTQEIEKRHSLPESFTGRHGRGTVSQSVDNAPEPSKRNRSTVRKNMYSHVDPEHAGMLRHPWSEDVKKALKDRFKLTGFRLNQLDAINATLGGNDAFVLMPTGGGKSLCYQLPAVVQSGKTKGITIVISPLLSLMNDQVQHLRKINIRAATLNSETTSEERTEIYNSLKENYPEQFIQLLYITPEMITKSVYISNTLSRLHRNKKLARIVIDEAHCVSQWGHDFRRDYVALGQVRKQFPNVPIMALTATATENVKVDVMHQLGMNECPVYSQSFNRPNLYYEVRKKRGKGTSKECLAEYVDLIKVKYKNQSGIIYTLSRKGTERLAATLGKEFKIKAHHYHADMPVQEKTRVQKDWQSGKIQVVVATIAFGMGIDKADVRFVIHDTIPKSLEGYYQETGRAGRDGKRSSCYLYYGYPDTAVLKRFIYENDASPLQKERQRRMLSSMVQFCENRSDCRRVQVLAYFGEKFDKEGCEHTCDNCSSDTIFQEVDFTAHATTAMKIVQKLQNENVTLLHCVDILRGAATKKIKDYQHDKVPGFGAAKDVARGEVERLYFRLFMENALSEHNVMKGGFASQYLNLGPNCRDFLNGKRKLTLKVQVSASPSAKQKQTKSARPQSTMVSSPAASRMKPAKRLEYGDDEDEDTHDDFVVSDDEDDAFEPVPQRRHRREETLGLGPPISLDQRMADVPDMHRVVITQFVDAAKSLEEKIRNKHNLRKPFFTEVNFREMAIRWTVTLDEMMDIPDINAERVKTFGPQFAALVADYCNKYNETLNKLDDRVIDRHENVIDLISDEEEYDLDDDVEAAVLEAEQGSKYFAKSQYGSNSKSGNASGRNFPWAGGSDAKSSNSRGGGSSHRGRGRGGKRSFSRKSNGSASGQSSSGVSKRKFSGGAKKSRASKAGGSSSSKGSNLMRNFGNNGGGGMGGGGIGMMPT